MFRTVRLLLAVALVAFLNAPASAQRDPGTSVATQLPDGWVVSFSPRAGFFLPGDGNSVRRPTYGFELVTRRRNSWFGARALFERSTTWNTNRNPTGSIVPDGRFIIAGSVPDAQSEELRFFETVMLDMMAFGPTVDGVRPYLFAGYGSKAIGEPREAGILPYSLTGTERARALHGGFGVEAPVGSAGAVVFEFGDYLGPNGGEASVHDLHLTLMARISGLGELMRKLAGKDGEDEVAPRG